ncbi:penicillin-binding transpeptidase domain-containing protein [Streptomyces sp. CA-111067]|uniref:penicillin-binding transpeptidase domain-containing protein n=1 Tax=Streptomyces sp. CA-111067 TaxID=3240046 RepID=UPI003D958D4B
MKIGIVGAVCAGMLGAAGYGAYNVYTSLGDMTGSGHGRAAGTAGATARAVAEPLSARQIADSANAFLAAWSAGDLAEAAALTDSAQDAATGLTDFGSQGHISSVKLTGIKPGSGGASFTVAAHVDYRGRTSTWTYPSALTVRRGADGKPAVAWAPSVLHPGLVAGDSIVTRAAQSPGIDVTDRHGTVLTGSRFPSLTRIIADIADQHGDQVSGGTTGIGTYVVHSDGSTGALLHTVLKGRNKKLPTTLDARLQAAAEKAVAGHDRASATALDIRDGSILAVANTPPEGEDVALQGIDAPGSTFKIVTAAALIQHSGMEPGSPAPCRATDNVPEGRIYHNDSAGLHNENADLRWDFANSCNTGFIALAPHLGAAALRATAAQFGLTQPWNIGTITPNDQPGFPDGRGPDEFTSEMIGQGEVVANPLIMASIAATAATGRFSQPRIVAGDLIDGVVDARGVGPHVSADLRELMRAAVTSGTASGVMNGFGPDSGAKTGSAEVDGQAATNGWFTAFAGNVSAAAIVRDAGHGNTSAGPIVAQILAGR